MTTTEKVSGWGIVDPEGHILLSTVGPSRRSAIVNFIVALCGVMVMNSHTDEQIDEMWMRHRAGHRVARVDISEAL